MTDVNELAEILSAPMVFREPLEKGSSFETLRA